MTRIREIQFNGQFYTPEEFAKLQGETRTGPSVMGDLPDFVSPIDGTVVRGRAGLRDHCERHNVVPTADLAGLPPKPANQPYQPDRAAIREEIRKQLYK